MNPLIIPAPIRRLIECKRRRCALLVGFLAGVIVALALAFGVLTIKELLEKLADKSVEIGVTAALVTVGVSR